MIPEDRRLRDDSPGPGPKEHSFQ